MLPCERCQGLMVETWLPYQEGPVTPSRLTWHCVNCGNYVDRVILANKALIDPNVVLPVKEVRGFHKGTRHFRGLQPPKREQSHIPIAPGWEYLNCG